MTIMPINNLNTYPKRKLGINNNFSPMGTKSYDTVSFKGATAETGEISAIIISSLKRKLTEFMASIASDQKIADLNKTNLEYQVAGEEGVTFIRSIKFNPKGDDVLIKDVNTKNAGDYREAIGHNPTTKKSLFVTVVTPPEGMINTTDRIKCFIKSKKLGSKAIEEVL